MFFLKFLHFKWLLRGPSKRCEGHLPLNLKILGETTKCHTSIIRHLPQGHVKCFSFSQSLEDLGFQRLQTGSANLMQVEECRLAVHPSFQLPVQSDWATRRGNLT